MTIQQITPTVPVCLGVCCPLHSECQRYALMDGAPESVQRIGTCDELGVGKWPLYVETERQSLKEAA